MNLINAREVLVAVKLLLRVSDSMLCSSQYRSLVQHAARGHGPSRLISHVVTDPLWVHPRGKESERGGTSSLQKQQGLKVYTVPTLTSYTLFYY